MSTQKGFTLMELMIGVALVAILTMIAVPSYQSYVLRSARANVQADLMVAAGAMERHRAQSFTYATAIPGTTFIDRSPADAAAGSERYTLTLVNLSATTYEVRAVSTGNLASGKTEALKINHLGQKCYKALAAGVTDCTIGTDRTWP